MIDADARNDVLDDAVRSALAALREAERHIVFIARQSQVGFDAVRSSEILTQLGNVAVDISLLRLQCSEARDDA